MWVMREGILELYSLPRVGYRDRFEGVRWVMREGILELYSLPKEVRKSGNYIWKINSYFPFLYKDSIDNGREVNIMYVDLEGDGDYKIVSFFIENGNEDREDRLFIRDNKKERSVLSSFLKEVDLQNVSEDIMIIRMNDRKYYTPFK